MENLLGIFDGRMAKKVVIYKIKTTKCVDGMVANVLVIEAEQRCS